MKCYRCKMESPDVVAGNPLCDDCKALTPKRDNVLDMTKLRMRIIKPKPFVDEHGDIIKDNPPLNKEGFWPKVDDNELWAKRGMTDGRKKHI